MPWSAMITRPAAPRTNENVYRSIFRPWPLLGSEASRVRDGPLRRYASDGGAVMLVTHDHEFAAAICQTIAVVKRGKIEAAGPADAVLATAAGHAATNIYSFPSYFLDRAVRRRSKLPADNSRDLQA